MRLTRCFGAVVLLFTPLTSGCTEDLTSPVPESILAAPTEVTVDGVRIQLQADTWRNMEPNGDDRLAVVLRLQATASVPIPSGIQMERVWVVYQDEAWEVRPRQERYNVIARGGPRWPVGSQVTVVLRFSTPDGREFLLQDPQAVIEGPS